MLDVTALHSLEDLIAKRRELADALRLIDATITEYNRAQQRRKPAPQKRMATSSL